MDTWREARDEAQLDAVAYSKKMLSSTGRLLMPVVIPVQLDANADITRGIDATVAANRVVFPEKKFTMKQSISSISSKSAVALNQTGGGNLSCCSVNHPIVLYRLKWNFL